MEWLAGCLYHFKQTERFLTPVLEAAPPHINHNERVFLTAMQSVLVQ